MVIFTMRVAIAQLNQVIGDLSGNAARILEAMADSAARRGALADHPGTFAVRLSARGFAAASGVSCFLRRRAGAARGRASKASPSWSAFPSSRRTARYNAVAVLRDGKVDRGLSQALPAELHRFRRAALFHAGGDPCIVDVEGIRVGIIICEDVWCAGPAARHATPARSSSSSPTARPITRSQQSCADAQSSIARARETGLAIVYVNRTGGRTSSCSTALRSSSTAPARWRSSCRRGTRRLRFAEFDGARRSTVRGALDDAPRAARLCGALTMGVRDYVGRTAFPACCSAFRAASTRR